MNQTSALFNRLLLTFALGLAAASLCAAQTPARSDAPAANDKTAAPSAPDKEKAAPSVLDEELAKLPAGRTVAKFFAAFNSGDLKQMRAFHEAYGGDAENADKDLDFYEQTGGLKLHSLARSTKDQIAVLAQTKKDPRWITFEFTLGEEPPHPINGIRVRPASAPEKP